LAGSGLRQTIDGLHPAVRCLSGSLEIAVDGDHTSAAGDHRGWWFVPSVFRWARVTAAVARGPVVVSYPARGFELVWEDAAGSRAAGLVPLLGRSRAAILEHLDVPRTTTNLSHRLGLAPGTVSTHLSVLTAAGLLHAWRDGRRVLYARNTLSTVLLGPS
jgi:DNA-binding transcriptional ArsR family regulator